MNKHMRGHSKRLNIKTTHLASLTAVFHSKKQPRPPTESRCRPPTTGTNQDSNLAASGSQVDNLDVTPEVQMSQLGDVSQLGTDDHDGSGSDEMDEGALEDFGSDEFESSDEEDPGCETRDGRGLLEFELNAAKAGNVHHGHDILKKKLTEVSDLQLGHP